ncbi:unnamed protein product, partial [Cyprideis torosa]
MQSPSSLIAPFLRRDELNSLLMRQTEGEGGIVHLTAALSAPFRRIEKYAGVLQELAGYMEDSHCDRGDASRAAEVMRDLVADCTHARRQRELELELLSGNVQNWEGEKPSELGDIQLLSRGKVSNRGEREGEQQGRAGRELELELLSGNVQNWEGEKPSELGDIQLLSRGKNPDIRSITLHCTRHHPEHFCSRVDEAPKRDYGDGVQTRSVVSERYLALFPRTLVLLSTSPTMNSFVYEGSLPLSGLSLRERQETGGLKVFELKGPLIEPLTITFDNASDSAKWSEGLRSSISDCLTVPPESDKNSNTLKEISPPYAFLTLLFQTLHRHNALPLVTAFPGGRGLVPAPPPAPFYSTLSADNPYGFIRYMSSCSTTVDGSVAVPPSRCLPRESSSGSPRSSTSSGLAVSHAVLGNRLWTYELNVEREPASSSSSGGDSHPAATRRSRRHPEASPPNPPANSSAEEADVGPPSRFSSTSAMYIPTTFSIDCLKHVASALRTHLGLKSSQSYPLVASHTAPVLGGATASDFVWRGCPRNTISVPEECGGAGSLSGSSEKGFGSVEERAARGREDSNGEEAIGESSGEKEAGGEGSDGKERDCGRETGGESSEGKEAGGEGSEGKETGEESSEGKELTDESSDGREKISSCEGNADGERADNFESLGQGGVGDGGEVYSTEDQACQVCPLLVAQACQVELDVSHCGIQVAPSLAHRRVHASPCYAEKSSQAVSLTADQSCQASSETAQVRHVAVQTQAVYRQSRVCLTSASSEEGFALTHQPT